MYVEGGDKRHMRRGRGDKRDQCTWKGEIRGTGEVEGGDKRDQCTWKGLIRGTGERGTKGRQD